MNTPSVSFKGDIYLYRKAYTDSRRAAKPTVASAEDVVRVKIPSFLFRGHIYFYSNDYT